MFRKLDDHKEINSISGTLISLQSAICLHSSSTFYLEGFDLLLFPPVCAPNYWLRKGAKK
jgi:hypothetical protein